jgi:hypothetical protein
MERVRPAPSPSSLEDVPSLPSLSDSSEAGASALSLGEQLNTLRSHDATPTEVDAFVKQFDFPVGREEARRLHADALLNVLEDERLSTLATSQGRRLGSAALESLKALGYPYALEVTPAMLARVQAHEPTSGSTKRLWRGFTLAAASSLSIWAAYKPLSPEHAGWFSALLLSPALLTLLARATDHTRAQRAFNVIHWLTGASCLVAAGLASTLSFSFGWALASAGVLALGSAWSLRHGPLELPPE